MPADCIPFKETPYFSNLILDYLDQVENLKSFYNKFPTLENFKEQAEEKSQSFKKEIRQVLVSSLEKQYEDFQVSDLTRSHINSLNENNTFTITTGHQLNIFTGPLYFLYKIVSTINLCKQLKEKYPKYNFVPIYWMATEDHDFDEINFFNFHGKKLVWNANALGAVGRLHTKGLEDVFEVFSKELEHSVNADEIRELFQKAYLEHNNLSDATRYLTNALFGARGLVVLDADTPELKKLFIPYLKNDLFHNTAFQKVSNTNKKLEDYKIQVNPREINLFYLTENLRERIEFINDKFTVLNTDLVFSIKELEKELDEHPERFSPNVIMRPLYQEVILPNLCYIGGGGELAYWLQLKSFFDSQQVIFPILLLRNSVLLITNKQDKKLKKLKLTYKDIFLKRDHFINKKVREISNIDIDFTPQREHLIKQFKNLYEIAQQTDKSFLGAVKAQEVKQLKGLDNLEKRLLKAQKRKLADEVSRMVELQNQLFPNENLQERTNNFSEFYAEFGSNFIDQLIKELEPLKGEFLVLSLQEN